MSGLVRIESASYERMPIENAIATLMANKQDGATEALLKVWWPKPPKVTRPSDGGAPGQ